MQEEGCSCTSSTAAPVLAVRPAHTPKLWLFEKNKAAPGSREQHKPPQRGSTTRPAAHIHISQYAKQQELPQSLKLRRAPADFKMLSEPGSCLLQQDICWRRPGQQTAQPGRGRAQSQAARAHCNGCSTARPRSAQTKPCEPWRGRQAPLAESKPSC